MTNIYKLQLVQNFATRIILGLRKYDHISAGLRSLRWLNVKQRLMVNDAVMMYKCLKGLSPCYLSNKFSTRATIHDRQTRYRDSLFHLVESMPANAPFIIAGLKYGTL